MWLEFICMNTGVVWWVTSQSSEPFKEVALSRFGSGTYFNPNSLARLLSMKLPSVLESTSTPCWILGPEIRKERWGNVSNPLSSLSIRGEPALFTDRWQCVVLAGHSTGNGSLNLLFLSLVANLVLPNYMGSAVEQLSLVGNVLLKTDGDCLKWRENWVSCKGLSLSLSLSCNLLSILFDKAIMPSNSFGMPSDHLIFNIRKESMQSCSIHYQFWTQSSELNGKTHSWSRERLGI